MIHHGDRLQKPLLKEGEGWRSVAWDEALSRVAERLSEIKAKHGSGAIGVVGSLKTTNEENYWLGKLARAGLGTNNIDTAARFYYAPGFQAHWEALGVGAMTNSILDIEQADLILLVGANPKEQAARAGAYMLRALHDGKTLIVADPRTTEMAQQATRHIRPKPGTDAIWINALMHILLERGRVDTDRIGDRGWQAHIQKFTPDRAEREAGVSTEHLGWMADALAEAERVMIFYGTGVTQNRGGVATIHALLQMAFLTDNLGRSGTGVNPLLFSNNLQGGWDMGLLPDFLPGHRAVTDVEARKALEMIWKVTLPTEPGLTLSEMIAAAESGELKALYVVGENLAVSAPDISRTTEALKKLDFLVVQDLFLTETAALADVVLPAASSVEKEGTFTSMERRIQMVRRAIPPWGDCKTDLEIFGALGEKIGTSLGEPDPQAVRKEIGQIVPFYAGFPAEGVEGNGGLQWPVTPQRPNGTPYLTAEDLPKRLQKVRLAEFTPPAEATDSDYPFTLVVGRAGFHWITGTQAQRSFTLRREFRDGFVEINPEDAQQLDIRGGTFVKLITRRGELIRGVVVTDRVPKGVIYLPLHYKQGHSNVLTLLEWDPDTKTPEFKRCAAKIERA